MTSILLKKLLKEARKLKKMNHLSSQPTNLPTKNILDEFSNESTQIQFHEGKGKYMTNSFLGKRNWKELIGRFSNSKSTYSNHLYETDTTRNVNTTNETKHGTTHTVMP